MTKDGLVSRNESTGEKVRDSQREQRFDLRGQRIGTPDYAQNADHGRRQSKPESQPLEHGQTNSQVGNTLEQQSGIQNPQQSVQKHRRPANYDNTQVTASPHTPPVQDTPIPDGGVSHAPADTIAQPTANETGFAVGDSGGGVITRSRKLDTPLRQPATANTKPAKNQGHRPAKTKRLRFEKEATPQNNKHLNAKAITRPATMGTNAAIGFAHSKLQFAEHENVGVKAAHRGEMLAETGVRSALRFKKAAPSRRIARIDKQAVKKSTRLSYQKSMAENPKLKSNVFSRMMQKRKIKKQYAAAARKAGKTAKTAKRAGSIAAKITKAVARLIIRHPFAATILILVLLLIFAFASLVGLFGGAGGGSFGAIIAGSYLAEDADIDQAVLAYTEWETDLRLQILNAESSHPGYDEYRYHTGAIGHDPFELMAYLTAVYQNFSYDAIFGDLRSVFDEQYTLTLTPTTEIRYRTVTNPDTGAETQEAYEWRVLTITLTAHQFSQIVHNRMDVTQQQSFDILMQTKGNRQIVGNPLGFGWLSRVTSNYGYRVHPIRGEREIHRGIDIALPIGTDIFAANDGIVSIGWDANGFGHYVVVTGSSGLVTKYAHLDSVLAANGQTVRMGELIAKSGNSGGSTGPHLHFEVLQDGSYVSPLFYADAGVFSLPPIP
jgi:murein DD-endopeptidase MepM/ murein hydrolase activator NlpD